MTYKELDELYDLDRLLYYGSKVSKEQKERFDELFLIYTEERMMEKYDELSDSEEEFNEKYQVDEKFTFEIDLLYMYFEDGYKDICGDLIRDYFNETISDIGMIYLEMEYNGFLAKDYYD